MIFHIYIHIYIYIFIYTYLAYLGEFERKIVSKLVKVEYTFDIAINKNSFLMTLSFEREAINQWIFQLYLKYLEKSKRKIISKLVKSVVHFDIDINKNSFLMT